MSKRRLLYVAMVGVLLGVGGSVWSAPRLLNEAVDVVGAEAEPLIAIEASRAGIVNRIMADYADGLSARNLDANALRHALTTLRADQLLAAALVNSLDEVLAIAVQPVATGPALQRYVAISPLAATDSASLPAAVAYLTRNGDALRIEKADEFAFRDVTTQVVGYFVPATTTIVITEASKDGVTLKDGTGSGPNSWIGYTTGNNTASGSGSAVAAGTWNSATGLSSMVVGGSNNTADGVSSLVIGGFDNHARVIDSMVGGGAGNQATGSRAVVVGGGYNLASGHWSFIGGGGRETGTGVAGASEEDHIASGKWSTIVGGFGNRATNIAATVAGGGANTASNGHSSVGGGYNNAATGSYATVGGGYSNAATGSGATVPGGYYNQAIGTTSFAAGDAAIAKERGMFVWADSKFGLPYDPTTFRAAGDSANTFNVRATGVGGVYFTTGINASTGAPTWGCYAQNGSGWTCTSDRNVKRNLEQVDAQDVLSRLAAMPVYHWQPKDGPNAEIRHIGPMAQDFYTTFGLGDSDKSIGMQDAEGVALAAIQGLNQKLDAQLKAQAAQIKAQAAAIAELRRAMEVLMARTSPEGKVAAR